MSDFSYCATRSSLADGFSSAGGTGGFGIVPSAAVCERELPDMMSASEGGHGKADGVREFA